MGEQSEHSSGKLTKFLGGVGKVASGVTKVVGATLAAGSAVITKVGKDAISAYGDYEQLVGGVETLFKDSADTVIYNASNAYKTAGMSANEYMETVTGFSAALLQSLDGDTVEAANKADMAISDMSDNANKMGTDMESIQNAYQGFSKQNYTMLDNLKLGYGGTKEEMQRLLSDAEKLSGQKFDISSYSDIVDAIHVVQTEMGITGTTAKEASTTIQGSLGAMKSSWQNLLTGLTDENADMNSLINNLFDSILTVADNLIPRVSQVLDGIADVIVKLAPKLLSKVSEVIDKLLPGVINGAVALINAIVDILPSLIGTLVNILPALIDGFGQIIDGLIAALPSILTSLMQGIVLLLSDVLPMLIEGLINLIVTIASNFGQIIQPLIDKLPEIIINVVNALMNNLPALIEGCIQLVIGIVQAIPQIILALIEALPTVFIKIVEGLINSLPVLLEGIASIWGSIGSAIWEYLSGFYTLLGEWFGGLWESIKDIFSPVIDFFKNLFSGAWEGIKSIWNSVSGFFSDVWNRIKNIFSPVINFFKNIFSSAWNGIKGIWKSVSNFFSGIWNGIKNAFSSVGSFFSDIFSGAWNGIKSIFSGVGDFFSGVFNRIVDVVKTPINWIISGINFLINGLNKISFDIPDWVPGVGGSTFGINIPNIPELAEGGVLKKGQTGYLEGDGDEAVVPLEKNTGWISRVAEQINKFSIETKSNIEGAVDVDKLSYAIKSDIGTRIDNVNDKFDKLIELIIRFFPEFAKSKDSKIVLDDDTLVGKLTPKIDSRLNELREREDVVFI